MHPVEFGRLAVMVQGAIPLKADLRFLKGAVPGDYLEYVPCDSGLMFEGESGDWGPCIIRVVSLQDAIRNVAPAYGHVTLTHTVPENGIQLQLAVHEAIVELGASKNTTSTAETYALTRLWSQKHVGALPSPAGADKDGLLAARMATVLGVEFKSGPFLDFAGNMDTQTVDGFENPFFCGAPRIETKSPDGYDAAMYGTPGVPGLCPDVATILDENNHNWLIPEDAPLYIRYAGGVVEAAAKFVELKTTLGADDTAALGLNTAEAEATRDGFQVQVKNIATAEDAKDLFTAVRAIPGGWSVGASFSVMEEIRAKFDFTKVAAGAATGVLSSLPGAQKLTAEEEAELKAFFKEGTKNPHQIMAIIRHTCGGKPLYIEHPLVRTVLFGTELGAPPTPGFMYTGNHRATLESFFGTYENPERVKQWSNAKPRAVSSASSMDFSDLTPEHAALVKSMPIVSTGARFGDGGPTDNVVDFKTATLVQVLDDLEKIPADISRVFGIFLHSDPSESEIRVLLRPPVQ
jgi:hypothetical protein